MNAEIEYIDRYTGTPMEQRPWLRGCFGECEAVGYIPSCDPREWPIMPGPWPTHPELRDRLDADGTTFIYVGPGWDPRGETRMVGEPDAREWHFALLRRGFWVPSSALDDGWAFLKCPLCNETGTVTYLAGLKRMPYLWKRMLHDAWEGPGWQGWPPGTSYPRLRTSWHYLTWGFKETWRALTWRAPEALR